MPILDFWGPYAGGVKEWMQCVCLCFTPLIFSAAPYAFNVFLFSRVRDCTIFTLHSLTDFYVERVTAHRIIRYDHSCFHNLWPNSKTKLKLKHLWEQGGVSGYSAYREDRLGVIPIFSPHWAERWKCHQKSHQNKLILPCRLTWHTAEKNI